MQDAPSVRVTNRVEHAQEQMHPVVDGEALAIARLAGAQLGDDVLHRLAVEVLHDEVDLSVLVAATS